MDADELQLPPILLPGYGERRLARSILVLTVLGLAMVWLVALMSPGIGGWTIPEPQPIEVIVPLAGIALQLLGVGWMVRIYRAAMDPEPDHGTWRYRAR